MDDDNVHGKGVKGEGAGLKIQQWGGGDTSTTKDDC